MRTLEQLRTGGLSLPLFFVLASCASGCDGGTHDPTLSRVEEVVRGAPVPPENAPQLGIVAARVDVREFTDLRAPSWGVLRAGARVARSVEPVARAGCSGGWYAIRPRGFVCVGVEATLDLNHPTLAAMALAPNLKAALPYTYARTRSETPLFERLAGHPDAVREAGKLRRRAGMAVVGSWKAKEPSGAEARLALLTDGRFVRAADLEAARASEFTGIELGQDVELPVAFVVKRGVRTFRLNGNEAEKGDLLEYHRKLRLNGRFRSLGSVKYWACQAEAGQHNDGDQGWWVRHQDVTVVQKRSTFPEFAKDTMRWLDLSTTTGTLVAYEGKRPMFATLLSVARELPESSGDQTTGAGPRPVPLGTFSVQRKALTLLARDSELFGEAFEVQDAPWTLELSSGQLIHGAYWHDRFGIEHGSGSIALSPADAARVFQFVGPELPSGWHTLTIPENYKVPVIVRK